MVIDYNDLMEMIHLVAVTLSRINKEHPELGLREAVLRILDRPVDENSLQFIRSSLVVLLERTRPFWPRPSEVVPASAN